MDFMAGSGRRQSYAVPDEIGNYTVGDEIGRGSFATVFKGMDKTSGKTVAIKSVDTERLNEKLGENLATEISIMKEFKHPNIVELYDIQKGGGHIHLVMEYCSSGDLGRLLRERKILPEAQVRGLIKQLAQALGVLAKANLVHRDLKPQNLLLASPLPLDPTAALPEAAIKLADFGFARYVEPTDMAQTLCGSPLYMAPEILRYERYDARADLWSVGAIMYEMLFGRPPFRAQNHIQLLRVIERAPGIPFPSTVFLGEERREEVKVSDACKELILGLLQRDPEQRLTFSQFEAHPFLQPPRGSSASAGPATSPLGKPSSGGRVQQVGFSIPRTHSSSSARIRPASLQVAISAIPASFKRASATSSAVSSYSRRASLPLMAGSSTTAAASLVLNDEAMVILPRLLGACHAASWARPALLALVERDTRLALILQELAESTLALLVDPSMTSVATGGTEGPLLGAFRILLTSLELLQGLLKHLNEMKPTPLPGDDASRALVLWLAQRHRQLRARLEGLQRSLDEGSSRASATLQIASSAGAGRPSPGATQEPITGLLYHFALKCARDGGVQELLGYQGQADCLYRKALFCLKFLMEPRKPAVWADLKEAVASAQDTRVILGYANIISQRLGQLNP